MTSVGAAPHTYYLAAVVTELARQGLEVSGWALDATEPLAGYLQLAGTHSGEHGAVVFGWCEERGWFHGRSSDGFAQIRRLAYVGGAVLPAPVVIAEQLAHAVLTAGTHPAVLRGHQPYRTSSDDDGLRAWLATYPPCELGHGVQQQVADQWQRLARRVRRG